MSVILQLVGRARHSTLKERVNQMSDRLQLVVPCPPLKLKGTRQPNVRYASACRRRAHRSSLKERVNQMSDMLQLVVPCPPLKLKGTRQPNVRYASACRAVPNTQA
jgi:hypothetical protein